VNRAVVITISDSASSGLCEDISGPAVVEKLRQSGFEVTLRDAIPDEREQIAAVLREEAAAGGRLAIFTTGGTGITPRDITPEATRDVIEREIPGIGELMRAKGRESTPFAVLSRAIAGNRGGVLIINLPGSPRGAVESLGAILELVPHVLDLINGRTAHSVS
jgi:molybdenum cofactor synthesis domain-containing protein